ncbi:MFS transporter [Crenobacter luteus]|uniref:Sodium:galactoside symporter n=1 Tax=Crenobacter luteus TaxID=1452487 RepID=A0A161SFJ7_9NEIS|nr:MFS transporter [Crenobacter luteus]KZE31479.1 hypothetical protein AVW16_11950 [Crenobacter luteus]
MRARDLACAGAGALPLAMVALPVYVHVPALYAERHGVPLAVLGGVFFFTRLIDTAQDPLIGWWQDRLGRAARLAAVGAFAVLGLVGFVWLVAPVGGGLLWQLALSLLCVYTAHGWLNIALLRYGAALGRDEPTRLRVVAWREGAGVIGVLLAAALPAWLAGRYGQDAGLLLFAALLAAGAVLSLLALLAAPAEPPRLAEPGSWRAVLADRAYLALLGVLFLNALAMSLPATLVNFFVADVLAARELSGAFLLVYFLAAVASLPGWVWLAGRVGTVNAWLAGLALAVAGFVAVPWLDAGDAAAFVAVCAATGVALGADLAFATSLVARAIGRAVDGSGGAYFGGVSLVNKLALALAAGVALPLVDWAGYRPGDPSGAAALSFWYAALPCAVKLAAVAVLVRSRPLLEVAR